MTTDSMAIVPHVDAITGELSESAVAMYSGASTLQITPEETQALRAPFDDAMVEIRPDGLLYVPQTRVRARLNDVLGIGQWALVQHSTYKDESFLYFDGSLFIRGVFVARAVGEAKKHDTNNAQSWAAVYESAKSDCIVRCCKDLSIASELWEPSYGRKWTAANAVKVWSEGQDKAPKRGFYWRRKDVEPFWWEEKQTKKPEPKKPEARTPAPYTGAPEDYIMPLGHSKGKRIGEIPIDVLEKARAHCADKPDYAELVVQIDKLFDILKTSGAPLSPEEHERLINEIGDPNAGDR